MIAPAGRVEAALEAIRGLPEWRGEARALPVVSERGVEQLGGFRSRGIR